MINTEESRKGAMACLQAMQIIERIENNPDPECMNEDWWHNKDAATAAMLHAAGVQSGFMAGFVATFAEYVSTIESSHIPSIAEWKPEAAMDEEEKAAYRTSHEEEGEVQHA